MFNRRSCQWRSQQFDPLSWRRFGIFTAQYRISCQASGNLGWLVDIREVMADRDALAPADLPASIPISRAS